MATKTNPQPINKYDQKSEAPKSGHNGLEPDIEFATQGVGDYELDSMRESPTRTGLQPKSKAAPTPQPATPYDNWQTK